jgi:HlyD family secretion protein
MKRVSVVLSLALLVACQPEDAQNPLMGTLERDRLELVAEAQEPITAILVTEGESVESGQLLATLDTTLHEAQLQQLQAAADGAAAALAEQVRGPRGELIEQAQARLAGARDDFAVQRKTYDRVASLQEQQLTSQANLDDAYNRRELARATFEEAQASLEELVNGTTAEEVEQAQATLRQAQATVAAMQITLDRLAIRAPRAGIIDALPYEVGERPAPGATIVVMLADTAPFARVFVPEPLRAGITPGTAATVQVDGITPTLSGRVRYISSDASYTPYYALTQWDRSRLAFVAEVTLTDERGQTLPAGVPVQVEFPVLP